MPQEGSRSSHGRKTPSWLTFSNLIAVTALFVALGGASYAAISINSGNIQNRTIKGIDVAKDTLGGKQVKESKLDEVPSAQSAVNAQAVQGAGLDALKLKCPADTDPHAGVCFEKVNRVLAFGPYIEAVRACGTDQRRLPTATELSSYLLQPGVDNNGLELTGDLFENRDQQLRALTVFDTPAGDEVSVSDIQVRSDLAEEIAATVIYRCVAEAAN